MYVVNHDSLLMKAKKSYSPVENWIQRSWNQWMMRHFEMNLLWGMSELTAFQENIYETDEHKFSALKKRN